MVQLTQAIDNDNGYVDWIVSSIKWAKGEDLHCEVCCVGGDTFQGQRLQLAVLEHEGETHARVVGLAASMGTSFLASFDHVEIVDGSELMFHKAFIIQDGKPLPRDKWNEEQKQSIDRFNNKTYELWINKEVVGDYSEEEVTAIKQKREAFFNKVFKSESTENHWLTAQEAEALGIGKVIKIERRDSKPFKVAASLDINQIKNQYQENMGLFSKEVPQVANLEDGRVLVFTSKKKDLAVADKVNLAGSDEKLNGEYKLANNMVATIKNGVVVNMDEETPDPDSDELADLKTQVEDLQESLKELLKKSEGDEEKEEMKAQEEEEMKAEQEEQVKNVAEAVAAATELVDSAMKVASTIQSSFKLENPDNKHEDLQEADFLKSMSETEKHAYEMRNVLNGEEVETKETKEENGK